MHHLRYLKWLNFFIGAYTFVAGLLFLLLFLLPWLIGDPQVPGWAFALMGLLGFVLFGLYGVAHVVLGYLVGAQRGRLAQTLFALIQVTSFPVGTAYAAYALYVCWVQEETRRSFDAAIRPPVT